MVAFENNAALIRALRTFGLEGVLSEKTGVFAQYQHDKQKGIWLDIRGLVGLKFSHQC